jgi:hypothetical protein
MLRILEHTTPTAALSSHTTASSLAGHQGGGCPHGAGPQRLLLPSTVTQTSTLLGHPKVTKEITFDIKKISCC